MGDGRDPQLLQLVGVAYPREHEQLRRVNRPRRQDDLSRGADGTHVGCLGDLDADRAVTLEDDLRHFRVEQQREVRAAEVRPKKARAALTREPSGAMFMLL